MGLSSRPDLGGVGRFPLLRAPVDAAGGDAVERRHDSLDGRRRQQLVGAAGVGVRGTCTRRSWPTGPSSTPAVMRNVQTPRSVSPAISARSTGAVPRQCGADEGCTTTVRRRRGRRDDETKRRRRTRPGRRQQQPPGLRDRRSRWAGIQGRRVFRPGDLMRGGAGRAGGGRAASGSGDGGRQGRCSAATRPDEDELRDPLCRRRRSACGSERPRPRGPWPPAVTRIAAG